MNIFLGNNFKLLHSSRSSIMSFNRFKSGLGDLGSGTGKGGGGGGSIREAGGAMGERGAAQEEEYFYKQQKDQVEKIKREKLEKKHNEPKKN